MPNNISLSQHAKIHSSHSSDVTWAWWRLKSPATWLFVHASTSSTNSKAPHYRPFPMRFNGEHGFHQKGPMILIELPGHDVIMYVNTRRSETITSFFNNSLSRTEDWVNHSYEISLKSNHTDELNSSVSYIYCWYLLYGRLNWFYLQCLTYFFLQLLSWVTYYLNVLPSALLLWHTDNFSIHPLPLEYCWSHTNELVNHPKENETILLPSGWASKP